LPWAEGTAAVLISVHTIAGLTKTYSGRVNEIYYYYHCIKHVISLFTHIPDTAPSSLPTIRLPTSVKTGLFSYLSAWFFYQITYKSHILPYLFPSQVTEIFTLIPPEIGLYTTMALHSDSPSVRLYRYSGPTCLYLMFYDTAMPKGWTDKGDGLSIETLWLGHPRAPSKYDDLSKSRIRFRTTRGS
jgi:hypothetical protein